jgi:hypothetical protein
VTSTQRRGRHATATRETFVCGQAAVQVLWNGAVNTGIVDSSGPWHAVEEGPAGVVFSLCGRQVARADAAVEWPSPRRTPACGVCTALAED